jgi:hypothetical protein
MLYICLGNSDGGGTDTKGRGDKSRMPDYGEKAACSPETNTGTERTKLLATVAEASFRVDESALWLR